MTLLIPKYNNPDEKSINLEGIIFASVVGAIGIVGAIMVITVFRKCSRKGRPNIYDQSINLSREANEEQYDYEALQKNKEHEEGYEEPLTGRIDNNTETTQQINNVPNVYIDICG
ncbi:uncharacterized protein LOC134281686 [Saccostrea cucullata]|uniref:uncharacterized protein LOC134281686 n=1 Tax=Saccostrea cuccullata TaxID=36930 RepID=UPI002ED08269